MVLHKIIRVWKPEFHDFYKLLISLCLVHSIMNKCIILTFDHKDGYKKRDEDGSLTHKGIPMELSGAWSRELLTTMLQALAKQKHWPR